MNEGSGKKYDEFVQRITHFRDILCFDVVEGVLKKFPYLWVRLNMLLLERILLKFVAVVDCMK